MKLRYLIGMALFVISYYVTREWFGWEPIHGFLSSAAIAAAIVIIPQLVD